MKKFIFLISVIILAFNSYSQISFFKAYSDFGYDKGEGIAQLEDSSYLITGSSSSFSNPMAIGSSQAFILKVDSLGNRLWSKQYGGSESDKGKKIFYVPNDGIYVVGQTNSFPNTFYDGYFFKTDLNGNLLYEKNFGGDKFEDIHDAVMLEDTSFILVGETQSTDNEVENIYVVRINKLGDVLWEKNFGTEGKDVARGIKLLTNNSVIIVGEYYVPDSLTQKAVIVKMHIGGVIEWLKVYGNKGKYVLNDVTIENNALRSVGYNQRDTAVEGNNSLFVLYTDQHGNFPGLNSEINQGDYSGDCYVKYGTDPNNYYFAMRITDNPSLYTYPDGCDLYIYKYGMNLSYNGLAFVPSNVGNDIPGEMIATSDGGAILVGSNEKPSNGGSNVILVKIGPNDDFSYSYTIPSLQTLVSVQEKDENPIFHISPNPVENELSLSEISSNKINSISIYNQQGKQILSKDHFQDKIDIQFLSSGLYFLVLQSNESKSVFKFMKN